jgi:hypothetical protein
MLPSVSVPPRRLVEQRYDCNGAVRRWRGAALLSWVNMKPVFSRNSDEAGRLDASLAHMGNSRTGDRDLFPARTNPDFVKHRFVLHTRYRVGERDPEIHARAENRAAPFQGS